MTKTSMTLLALACALSLSACGKQDAADAGHDAKADAAHASSSAGLPHGDAAAGKALAANKGASGQACVDCHGADGNAPIDATYPKLGGQYADYLVVALKGYRAERRKNAIMGAQAKPLSNADIENLAAYYARLPSQLSVRK